ncbi:MAG: hypothetical protein A4S14_05660 [Proteobacteria bacterium SG_bin9]|nr:MAG: hypothetical protein A4S14_05660 [Proteobacteria bacterium SG_bin9]
MLRPEDSAAQYVRMSTDMQVYSIEHQCEAIAVYAARRGLTIIKNYEDAGRSGVTIYRRAALQTLLDDVTTGRAQYSTILVYDVSRWGRFEDTDESAYYEYMCKKAGVSVQYCAEEFENDGSLTATILKNIKRAMAGEYSRELSVKSSLGKRKLAHLGFSVGGAAVYGLRRALVDENRKTTLELNTGEWKRLQFERTILVPGPDSETNAIRRMYDLYVKERLKPTDIVRKLNDEGVPGVFGRPWNYNTVKNALTNEKYIGNTVFNQTSKGPKGRRRWNARQEWLRCEGAIEPIISPDIFAEAQRLMAESVWKADRKYLLDALTALWCSTGKITALSAERSRFVPTRDAYIREFGSLGNALRQIGYRRRIERFYNADIRKDMIAEITREVTERGGSVVKTPRRKHLTINDSITVHIFISHLRKKLPNTWLFGYVSPVKPDVILAARIEKNCGPIVDYLILPYMFLPHGQWITMSTANPIRLERFRCKTLEPFYALCARSRLVPPAW